MESNLPNEVKKDMAMDRIGRDLCAYLEKWYGKGHREFRLAMQSKDHFIIHVPNIDSDTIDIDWKINKGESYSHDIGASQTMKNNLKEGEGVKALSAPEVLDKHIKEYNKTASDYNKFALSSTEKRVFIAAMEEYALQSTPKLSEKVYPIGGFAHGSYQNKCCTCDKLFIGDKRAVQCEPCAMAMPNSEPTVQASVATDDDSSTTADPKNKLSDQQIEAMATAHALENYAQAPKQSFEDYEYILAVSFHSYIAGAKAVRDLFTNQSK